MTRRLAPWLLGLALALTGCTSDSGDQGASPTPSESSSSAPQAEAPEPPKAGACYELTVGDAARPTTEKAAVPCRKRHTALTVYVGKVATVVSGHSLRMDSEHVQQQLAARCPAAMATYLGGDPQTRALSRFQVIWFSPTLEEADQGADWFRCDLIAFGDDSKLLELPAGPRLRGVLDRPDALDTYGLCGTAQPGQKGFKRVACSLPHSWSAISTIPITGGERYPGTAAVSDAGDQTCSDQVNARTSDLKFSYGWEWPTKQQWESGQHYGLCWAPSA